MSTSSRIGLLTALVLTGLAACAPAQTGAPAPANQVGRWLTESGNLEVDIAPCGKALCGTVTRVVANNSMAEPGKAMAGDPQAALGLKILSDFVPAEDGAWTGQIFNRENGKTYDCIMSLEAPDQLKLRAYVGSPLIGKTQIWRRVPVAAKQG
jgi:uncharacterized protein (DUF2147 family)